MPDRSSPTVLVTNAGHGSAIAIIRALGRKGCRVLAGGSEPDSAGFHSRYTAGKVLYPSADENPTGCIDALLQAAREHGVDLIIPVSDSVILPLAEARDRFEGVCRLAIPDAEGIAATTNKLKTLALAERLGVPTPRTRLADTTSEAMGHAEELGWPVVLKPLSSRLYRDRARVESYTVSYANSPEQVRRRMGSLVGRCSVLIQEYFPGTGRGVELLMHEGRPLAAFQHRRLHEVPITGGASSFRESVPLDPELFDYAVRMLREIRWTGLAMVEFKVGPEVPRLMEINGRIWGSLPLAILSGMDFPSRLVDLLLQGAPPPETPVCTDYRVGVRARNLELDLAWIGAVLARHRRYPFLKIPSFWEGVVGLFDLANPRCKFDVLSFEDPLPGLAKLATIADKVPGKLRSMKRERSAPDALLAEERQPVRGH